MDTMEPQYKSRDVRLWNVDEMQTSRAKGLRSASLEAWRAKPDVAISNRRASM